MADGKYVKLSGILYQVVTDYSMAKEYFLYQSQLNLEPTFISVTGDTEVEDVDGYDFGNPAGGATDWDLFQLKMDAKDPLGDVTYYKDGKK